MKLSSITNKHPEGQWFNYGGVLEVKLKYGQGLEHKLAQAGVKFTETLIQSAKQAEEIDQTALSKAEQDSLLEITKILCEDYFVDFRAVNDLLEEDDGGMITNTLENRVRIMQQVSELYDFIDTRVSNYSYWV